MRRITYTLIIAAYVLLLIVTPRPELNWLGLIWFILSAYGLSWFVTQSKLFWPRDLFVITVVYADGEGAIPKNTLGELLTCPICTSAWVALGLLWLIYWQREFADVLMIVTGVMGAVKVLR